MPAQISPYRCGIETPGRRSEATAPWLEHHRPPSRGVTSSEHAPRSTRFGQRFNATLFARAFRARTGGNARGADRYRERVAWVLNMRTRYANPLVVLVAFTLLLLAIACVNLSGLLIARAAAAERQWAICQALGASRARLAQQIVLESLMLSLAGAAAALPWPGGRPGPSPPCCGSARSICTANDAKLPVLVLTAVISVAAV